MKLPRGLSWPSLVYFILLFTTPVVEPSGLWAQSVPADAWDVKARPLFEQYCLGCHGPESPKGGLRLDQKEAVLRGGKSGRAIVPGQSSESWLIKRVRVPSNDSSAMPPQGLPRPTAEQIRILAEWIDQDAREVVNQEGGVDAASDVTEPQIAYSELAGSVDDLNFEGQIHPFLRHYCYDCHDSKTREGGFDVEESSQKWKDEILHKWNANWGKMAQAITTGSMPHPSQQRQPSEQERELFGLWFERELESRATPESSRASNPRLRQLTPFEYDNTVRELTGLDLGLSRLTQPGGPASDGDFLNQGLEMQLSPSKLSRYLLAANRIVAHASIDPELGIRFHPEPGPDLPVAGNAAKPENLRSSARGHLSSFATRAYRRPLHDTEVASFMALYDRQIEAGLDYQNACRQVLQGILASPQFVYLPEQHRWEVKPINWGDKKRKGSKATALLGDYEVASRLSYFLWSAPPDEELMRLAKERQLHRAQVLRAQVRRMLADPKSAALATQFAGYWLKFNKVADHLDISRQRFPEFSESLQQAMYGEVRCFVEEIIRQDLSILNLLDSDFTFVNRELASHYGMQEVSGEGFQKVGLTNGHGRGGLLGMAGILSLTSHPNRRSAVERGAYILREVLGTRPLPPPVSVGKLKGLEAGSGPPLTMAETLQQHRQDTRCAGCHSRIDPLGLALEEFDGIGRRTQPKGQASLDEIDTLPDGTQLQRFKDLKRYLLQKQQRRKFIGNFSKRLLNYALTRELQSGDFYTLVSARRALEENDYRPSAAVGAIVTSKVFLERSEE